MIEAYFVFQQITFAASFQVMAVQMQATQHKLILKQPKFEQADYLA